MAENKLPASASTFFDLLRGLAAVLVLVNHARALFLVDSAGITAHGPWIKPLYFLTGFGHQAVVVFFVLSGFFIGSGVIRRHETGRWSPGSYLLDRLTRLWVVLLPALVLTLGWDLLGQHLFAATGIYQGHPSNAALIPFAVGPRDSAASFLASALFLQEIVLPPFGSNSPLWSLSYEFWYYIGFPLTYAVLAGPTRVMALLALVGLGVMAGPTIASYYAIWLLGLLPLLVLRGRTGVASKAWMWLGGIAAVGTASVARLGLVPFALGADLALGFAMAALLAGAIASAGDEAPTGLYRRVSTTLAGFSYSLYVLHMPLLLFLQAWLVGTGGKWQPDLTHVAAFGGIVAGVLVYAWGLSRLTEAHTERVRRYLGGLNPVASPSP